MCVILPPAARGNPSTGCAALVDFAGPSRPWSVVESVAEGRARRFEFLADQSESDPLAATAFFFHWRAAGRDERRRRAGSRILAHHAHVRARARVETLQRRWRSGPAAAALRQLQRRSVSERSASQSAIDEWRKMKRIRMRMRMRIRPRQPPTLMRLCPPVRLPPPAAARRCADDDQRAGRRPSICHSFLFATAAATATG